MPHHGTSWGGAAISQVYNAGECLPLYGPSGCLEQLPDVMEEMLP